MIEGSGGETDADGHKRKRRRRRRGRPGEPREGGFPRDENEAPQVAASPAADAGAVAGETESDEDEADDQPGAVRADQAPGGERRPRRRGRRGGRRRRGGPEDGLAGSIADELGPTSVSEATGAVADFDGAAPEPHRPATPPEPFTPAPALQHADHSQQPVAPAAPAHEETSQEAERAARRRSTVREKVSFMADAQPDTAPAVSRPPEPSAPAPAESAPADDGQPRKAGWWSRRFGNGSE
jgi:ribonuclease E